MSRFTASPEKWTGSFRPSDVGDLSRFQVILFKPNGKFTSPL